MPVAFIVPKDVSKPPSGDELAEFCRGRIANFKSPRRYFVVEEMPGWMHKIQRHRLREDAIARLGTDEFE